jgi:exodeoxyribonuclease V alpha subunit
VGVGVSRARSGAGDIFLVGWTEENEVAQWVMEVVGSRIPARLRLDLLRAVIVLSPMRRGEAGVGALNEELQVALNPPTAARAERAIGGRVFSGGERVMQLRNNHDRDASNGGPGRVVDVDLEMQTLVIDFDGSPVAYDWVEADELALAHAASVHKAQGSEYLAGGLALLPRHGMLLPRDSVCTAVTRARRLCVLVGSRRPIGMALRNAKVARRWCGLRGRLGPGLDRPARLSDLNRRDAHPPCCLASAN